VYCITLFNLVCIFTSNFDERTGGIVVILYHYKNTYLSHLINYSSQSLYNIISIVHTNISTHTHFSILCLRNIHLSTYFLCIKILLLLSSYIHSIRSCLSHSIYLLYSIILCLPLDYLVYVMATTTHFRHISHNHFNCLQILAPVCMYSVILFLPIHIESQQI